MATPTTLPASFTAGQVLTAAQMNDLRGAFRVLQVVAATTSTQVTNSTNVYVDTGLTATITPTSATSKILVMYSQNGGFKSNGSANNRLSVRLMRGATGIQKFEDCGFTGTALTLHVASISAQFLDSPATTSATTYKTQFLSADNAASVAVQVNGLSDSTIILAEISA